jgi:hypothetical protein
MQFLSNDAVVWDKLVIPILVALFSWFLKDFFLGITNARERTTREEWEFRLKEVWGPLYLWSGVVCFDKKDKEIRYGIEQLSEALARAAYLLPVEHYTNLIKLLQQATDQKTAPLSFADFAKTRRYIYGQIEVLNHVLYKQYEWLEPATQTDVLASAKQLLRLVTDLVVHLVVWITIGGLLFALYVAVHQGYEWILAILGIGACVLALVEAKRRRGLRRQIRARSR